MDLIDTTPFSYPVFAKRDEFDEFAEMVALKLRNIFYTYPNRKQLDINKKKIFQHLSDGIDEFLSLENKQEIHFEEVEDNVFF